jgi:hypothetical protein
VPLPALSEAEAGLEILIRVGEQKIGMVTEPTVTSATFFP